MKRCDLNRAKKEAAAGGGRSRDGNLRGQEGETTEESESLRTRLLEVQESVSRRDRAELKEEFGEGPYRV